MLLEEAVEMRKKRKRAYDDISGLATRRDATTMRLHRDATRRAERSRVLGWKAGRLGVV